MNNFIRQQLFCYSFLQKKKSETALNTMFEQYILISNLVQLMSSISLITCLAFVVIVQMYIVYSYSNKRLFFILLIFLYIQNIYFIKVYFV